MSMQEARPSRFSDDYDESMEETIKAPRGNRSNRSSGIFMDMRQHAESAMGTPQRAQTMPMGVAVPDYMNMSNVNAEFLKIDGGYDGLPVVHGVHMMQPATPLSSRHPTASPFDNKPDLHPMNFDTQSAISPFGQLGHSPDHSATPSRRSSPHRRTESLASIASAASISSLVIEETRTETGITLDDIATYIEGPDPADGKWVCLYEDCGKKFGRKENIKSHVQTHLNDRQYQCPNCQKCFVRQHDLKRHAKIHTGIKPYPCDCGNTFARHDALTRHRQRGMCIGAFDGIVRKVVKRGRPRKHRPDMAARIEKSARTRSKNKNSASSPSATSQSGYSDSSAPNSPSNDLDNMLDDPDFDNMMDVAMSGIESGSSTATTSTMDPSALTVSSAPMPTLAMTTAAMNEVLAVVSPEHISSPSTMSHYSHVSLGGDDPTIDGLPAMPGSPTKSVASHYTAHPGTPPELSASSSPPSSSTRFFDLDPNSSCTEESIGLSAPPPVGCGVDMGNISSTSLEEDLLKAFTTEDGLVQLDNSGFSMLNSSKFEDEYGMFTNDGDVLF
jgi:regulatory protein SWI5